MFFRTNRYFNLNHLFQQSTPLPWPEWKVMIAERIARKEAKERAKVEKAAAEKAAALEVSLSV